MEFAFTEYFEKKVLAKRPYLSKEMCVRVVSRPVKVERQSDNARIRYWAQAPELAGRYLRVVTLADGRTIHNAFPDRGFKP